MNFRIVSYFIGVVLKFEGLAMILPMVIALCNHEEAWLSFLFVIIGAEIFGFLLGRKKWKNDRLYIREGYTVTALSWILLSLVGALPFFLSGKIPKYIDAVFETASGFTTTGASILSEVEYLGKGLLFWRSFTHFFGGMGVLVLVLAILPLDGGYHMQIMKAESPGPSVGKLVPRVSDTAKKLYFIYIGMTVLAILCYLISGMDLFDAVCIGVGTAGTGGFAVRNTGMMDYSRLSRDLIALFMILFGVNFNVYYLLLKRKFRDALKSEEVFCYLMIIAAVILFLTVGLKITVGLPVSDGLHHSLFTVASLISSTGFSTLDFSAWPMFLRMILLLTMFVGACAGSTGGGFKVSRIVIVIKEALREIHLLIHPESVKVIRMDGKVLDHSMVHSVTRYFIIYIFVFLISLFLISFDGFDFETNFSAVLATLNNIGPGLGTVGPTGNFSAYSLFAKIILTFDMIAGRLELLPVLLLFYKKTWTKHY